MNNGTEISIANNFVVKSKALFQLLKFRLTFLVTFSGSMAFLLGSNVVNYQSLILFIIGGFLVTGSANIINQIIEKDLDKLMSRTQNRPLPLSILSVQESVFFCVVIGLVGLAAHWAINPLTALISLLSLLLYGFAYTPLKRIGPIAVFVGAFPGAFPPLIGWVAATNSIDTMVIVLFGIQFLWQFPHFWAIAWVAHDDYIKAGFKLLPSKGGRDINTAFNIMIYALFLIPASILPYMLGITGKVSAVIVIFAGLLFLMQTFQLMKNCDKKAALQMMFGSFFYLPIVQIAFVFDKI